MSALGDIQSKRKVSILCTINPASLGDSDKAFVVLRGLKNAPDRPAWVPRQDVEVLKQPLNGRLKALVRARLLNENGDAYTVSILNDGNEEVLEVSKKD